MAEADNYKSYNGHASFKSRACQVSCVQNSRKRNTMHCQFTPFLLLHLFIYPTPALTAVDRSLDVK